MDISPVSAIRPVTPIQPALGAPDLSRVFEVEYLGQSDDEYTPAGRKPGRGLEDEENENREEAPETVGAPEEAPNPAGYGSVSLFA